jgi:hypothetical protein
MTPPSNEAAGGHLAPMVAGVARSQQLTVPVIGFFSGQAARWRST